jgi:hypothetical protein
VIWKIFSGIKTYLYLGIGLLVAALGIAVKFLAGQNSKLKTENKAAKARTAHDKKVMQKDREIVGNEQARETQIINDLRDGKSDYDPNSLFVTKDGD